MMDLIPPTQIKTCLWKVSTKIRQSSPDGQFSISFSCFSHPEVDICIMSIEKDSFPRRPDPF